MNDETTPSEELAEESVLELQGEEPDVEGHAADGSCFSFLSVAIN
jgi:hypothetical protein